MKATRQTIMAGLVQARGWRIGVELGVWEGALFGHLLATCPRLVLSGVDHWKPVGPYATKDMAAAEAKARAIAAKYPHRCQLLKLDTVGAAGLFMPASLDFVFVDAAHDYESVRADLRAWLPAVKHGGAMTGHDCNLAGVVAALDEVLPGWAPIGANCWRWENDGR